MVALIGARIGSTHRLHDVSLFVIILQLSHAVISAGDLESLDDRIFYAIMIIHLLSRPG